jgi:hypothetical protein
MMRIIVINGSHRGDRGLTRFFLDGLGRGATQAGAEFEVITLARLKIKRCLSTRSTQRRERQEIVPVPLFSVLKHLRPITLRVIEYLRSNEIEKREPRS